MTGRPRTKPIFAAGNPGGQGEVLGGGGGAEELKAGVWLLKPWVQAFLTTAPLL